MRELKVYSAEWCANCKTLKRQLDKEEIKYTTVDADTQMEEFEKANITHGIPVMIIYDGDREVCRYTTFNKQIISDVKEILSK